MPYTKHCPPSEGLRSGVRAVQLRERLVLRERRPDLGPGDVRQLVVPEVQGPPGAQCTT